MLKNIIILIILLLGFLPAIGQELSMFYSAQPDSAEQDSLDKICVERGHITDGLISITAMYNPPQYVDLPNKTLVITHDRNTMTGTCQRCGRMISEPVQAIPDTSIIWKRGDK